MMLFENGTINGDIDYKDLCKEEYAVRIAYNNDLGYFQVDELTNTMNGTHYFWRIFLEWGQKSQEHEILGSFFSKYNVKPKWINCNYSWGTFDDQTGHWSGAVGQVF